MNEKLYPISLFSARFLFFLLGSSQQNGWILQGPDINQCNITTLWFQWCWNMMLLSSFQVDEKTSGQEWTRVVGMEGLKKQKPHPCVFIAFVLPHTLESWIKGVHDYKLAYNTMCSVGPRREIEICLGGGFLRTCWKMYCVAFNSSSVWYYNR